MVRNDIKNLENFNNVHCLNNSKNRQKLIEMNFKINEEVNENYYLILNNRIRYHSTVHENYDEYEPCPTTFIDWNEEKKLWVIIDIAF